MKKTLVAMIFAIAVLLMTSTALAAGGQIGAFTYELKGNGTAIITHFDWDKHTGGDVYVPRSVDGYQVTEIGTMAFSQPEAGIVEEKVHSWTEYKVNAVGQAVAVVLPDTITVISDKAFFCSNIASCDIPASVQLIGSGAFSGCPNIRQFSVNSQNRTFAVIDGVLFNKTKKEIVAFPGAFSENSYVIPHGIKSIGDYAFYGLANRTINFAETITHIGDYAFFGAWGIRLNFNSAIEAIGDYAFACVYAKSAYGQVSPKIIGNYSFYAFNACRLKSDVAFLSLENMRQIGEGAFWDAYVYSYLDMKEFLDSFSNAQITVLPSSAFRGFEFQPNIEITFPETLTQIGACAFYDTKNLKICIPQYVATIENCAFAYANNLSVSFVEGSNLRTIQDEAFLEASINSITFELPDGIEELGYRAFYFESRDYELNKLVIPDSVSIIGEEIVNRTSVVLQVTPGSYADLWASENGYPMETNDTSWLFE